MPEKKQVSQEDYDEAIEARRGYCPKCVDFTTPGIGPKQVGFVCVDCGDDGVVGAHHAKRNGFIEVADAE